MNKELPSIVENRRNSSSQNLREERKKEEEELLCFGTKGDRVDNF
jgi:hypothetical protein